MENRPKPMERKLFLSRAIDIDNVGTIIQTIDKINADDDEKSKTYINWIREPIQLYISSYGGDAYAAFGLVDMIRASKTPVHTIALGYAMSAGLIIFMAGHRRFIGRTSTLMFHDTAWNPGNGYIKTEEIKQNLEESRRLNKIFCKLMLTNTKVIEDDLENYINRKAEWFISAEDAIELGLAHEYFK